ncbi:MAG: D-glycerate dehydrogenase [Candidatus Melainabacteria bacterium]|nr:D-glycerate dehydrogenase [Candidatus Melainabacteria bacterium]
MKVFVTGKLSDKAAQALSNFAQVDAYESDEPMERSQVEERLEGKDALVCILGDRVDAELFTKRPQLKLVANVAVGYDNINISDANDSGVLITNTPGVLDNATADLAFGLLLAAARRIVEADGFVRRGEWTGWKRELMLGAELNGKTLGIIGMGRIGKAVAKRARAFGLNIIYARKGNDKKTDDELKKTFQAERVELNELCRRADFISVNCPLRADTRHLINKNQFDIMQPHCVLINTSRGAVIDEQALVQAMEERKIASCGLDVFENEPQVPEGLLALDNVVLAPHIGSATRETRAAMDELAVKGLIEAFNGKLPTNAVNPDVWQKFSAKLKTTASP